MKWMTFHALTKHRLSGSSSKRGKQKRKPKEETTPAEGFFIGGEATREAFYSRLSPNNKGSKAVAAFSEITPKRKTLAPPHHH